MGKDTLHIQDMVKHQDVEDAKNVIAGTLVVMMVVCAPLHKRCSFTAEKIV